MCHFRNIRDTTKTLCIDYFVVKNIHVLAFQKMKVSVECEELAIPVRWGVQIRGNGFAFVDDLLEIDDSRDPALYDQTFVTPTTVVIPDNRNNGPAIKEWLTKRGANPEIWFIEGNQPRRMAFKFDDGNEAAAFKLFFA